MMYIFLFFHALGISSVYPLISSNITKAVGPARQGELGGRATNTLSMFQTISSLISTGFLEIGGFSLWLIYLD
ncbi:MAG: hypothetical protein ACFFG0_49600 [Candidatus Thorarchaeota archaeon]